MGWLRLVGSLKLYVSFAEYSLFYRALLQKRPIIKETYNFKEPTKRSHPIPSKEHYLHPKKLSIYPKRNLFTTKRAIHAHKRAQYKRAPPKRATYKPPKSKIYTQRAQYTPKSPSQ